MPETWRCPHCNNYATIGDNNTKINNIFLFEDSYLNEPIGLIVHSIICPNGTCSKPTITAAFGEFSIANHRIHTVIKSWKLMPESNAIQLPDYIPKPLREDYEEACKILDLSPKASATLARRCLQGMIRDFWGVSDLPNLYQEIQAIEDKVDPETWSAIDSIRDIGNIGAHMQHDINLIVSVEPHEAQLLLKLIEDLFQDWYIQRHQRSARAAQIVEMAQSKKEAKKVFQNDKQALPAPSNNKGE